MTRLAISSYAASPAFRTWDPTLEGEFLTGLRALSGVIGLEVPWIGSVHPHDDAWFLHSVPAGTALALTPLPWVMRSCAANPRYGIASRDEEGRRAAIDDLARVAADARMLASESAAHVAVVELHTAPHRVGSALALQRTLEEVADWDWGGARLVIEHCDAAVPGQAHEKGFLPIETEIDAIERTATPVGMWLNWGRSAIELRDADAVTAQIRTVAERGHLVGLGISGVGTRNGPYGAAWTDAHLPVAEAHPESTSLLDLAHVRDALAAAGDVDWLTLKVSRRPADASAAAALATVAANLDIVRTAQ